MKKVFLMLFLLVLFFPARYVYSNDDFSSIRLVSIAKDDSLGVACFKFTALARKAGYFESVINLNKALGKSLEYFFLGLILREKALWVNLDSVMPNQTIDRNLGDVDLGRVMLTADLRLKEDVCAALNPRDSPKAAEFWRRLWVKAKELGFNDSIPLLTRFWILPDKVEVSENKNRISIVKASLKVELEPSYYQKADGSINLTQKELQDFASGLMNELIIPGLTKRVNVSYAYADLRDVFQAIILAKCFREKFVRPKDNLFEFLDFGLLKEIKPDYFNSPDDIYQDYLYSVNTGEYSFDAPGPYASGVIIKRHYFSGGINFKTFKIEKSQSQDFLEQGKEEARIDFSFFLPDDVSDPLGFARNELRIDPAGDSGINGLLSQNLPGMTQAPSGSRGTKILDTKLKTDHLVLNKL